MDWNNAQVLKFIKSYRRKEILWDPSHRSYYNKNMKSDAWDALALELKRPVDELKKKMDYLLSALRRERAKIKKSNIIGKGAGDMYHSAWYAFPHLQFLLYRTKPRARVKTIDSLIIDSSDTEETSLELAPGNNESQAAKTQAFEIQSLETQDPENEGPETQVSESKGSVRQQPKKRVVTFRCPLPKKRPKKIDQVLHSTLELMKSSTTAAKAVAASSANSGALDHYQIYANYLASKFRTYSRSTYLAVEHQFNNILCNADSGQYDWLGYRSKQSNDTTSEIPSPMSSESASQFHVAERQEKSNDVSAPSDFKDNLGDLLTLS